MKQCSGYDSTLILQKVKQAVLKVKRGEALYERDSVLFHKAYLSLPFLKGLEASIQDNRLHVVDFGGSLGSTYFQYKSALNNIKNLKWTVVEQVNYVEAGKKEIEENVLTFCFTVKEALKNQQPQLLLLSSVLPYIEEPFVLIKELMRFDFEYILIDRTNFIKRKKDQLTVQEVPAEIYEASYPCWFFNENNFLKAFSDKYQVVDAFDNEIPPPQKLGLHEVYWKGFYLKRKGAVA